MASMEARRFGPLSRLNGFERFLAIQRRACEGHPRELLLSEYEDPGNEADTEEGCICGPSSSVPNIDESLNADSLVEDLTSLELAEGECEDELPETFTWEEQSLSRANSSVRNMDEIFDADVLA